MFLTGWLDQISRNVRRTLGSRAARRQRMAASSAAAAEVLEIRQFPAATSPAPFLSDGATITGTGDYDRNGSTDLLVRDSSGETYLWLMNGSQRQAALHIGRPNEDNRGFKFVGMSDVNRDGKADLIMELIDKNSPCFGQKLVWIMDGTQQVDGALFAWRQDAVAIGPEARSPNDELIGVADFDRDGQTDLILRERRTDGKQHVAIWLMNGLNRRDAYGLSPACLKTPSSSPQPI